jgi:hypothetical protein
LLYKDLGAHTVEGGKRIRENKRRQSRYISTAGFKQR